MTKEEMREFLDSHFRATNKIKALEVEIKALSATEGNAVAVQKLEEEISLLRTKQNNVRETIRQLHDDDLESVLIMRYINHVTIEKIAEMFGYEPRTIYRKIKKAIVKLVTTSH